jgi:uncharacterized membrane protein YjdF
MNKVTFLAVLALAIMLLEIFSAISAQAEPAWKIQTIDAKALLNGASLALDSNGYPHVNT